MNNYDKLKGQVLQQIQTQQGGKSSGKSQPTLTTITTTINSLDVNQEQLTNALAAGMCRDILSEQGVPQADIERALSA